MRRLRHVRLLGGTLGSTSGPLGVQRSGQSRKCARRSEKDPRQPNGSGTTKKQDAGCRDAWAHELPFADFLALYQNRTGDSGGQLLYQILHADRIPEGVQPATAVPFALTLASEAELAATEPPSRKTASGGERAGVAEERQRATGARRPPAAAAGADRAAAGSARAPALARGRDRRSSHRFRARDGRATTTTASASWDLDQLDGMKHPEKPVPPDRGDAATAALILAEWPYLEGDDGQRICMDLEVL